MLMKMPRRFVIACFYAVTALLLPAVMANEPAAAETSSPQDRVSDTKEQVWLNTGAGKSLGFYLQESSGKAHGGVLIVPDVGHHPVIHDNINVLRHTLANNHWHTLSLDAGSHTPEALQQLIAAGIALLNEKGVFNIAILGEGQGAVHALKYVAKLLSSDNGDVQQIRALIMINADNHLFESPDNAMAALSSLSIPVLDAFLTNDLRQQQRAAERKQLSKRGYYQQTRLSNSTLQDVTQDNPMTKRVRGWLDRKVAGFMVDRR